MTKVFISYSSVDREFAAQVRNALTQAGIESYPKDVELTPGADVASTLRNEVRSADGVVAILSDKAMSNNEIFLEIGMAQGLGKTVIAVLAPGSKADLPLLRSLSDTYVLDAAKLKSPELGEKISKGLSKQQQIESEHRAP
jgi:nucleoside 2-deoxyribosyltransferase